MLSLQDCLDYCDLTEKEIEAIAEHEHVPDVIAAEMAMYMVQTSDGILKIKRIILDDIEIARKCQDAAREKELVSILHNFVAQHPDFKPSGSRPNKDRDSASLQ